MAGTDALVALAEVAIALAGFSAVVSVFRRTQGTAWKRSEVNGVWIMMEMSFGLLFLSLLPLVLQQTGWGERVVWASACGALGAFSMLDPWVWLARMRRWSLHPRRPYLFRFIVTVSFLIGATELLAAIGIGLRAGALLYLCGLLWLLTVAMVQFLVAFAAYPVSADEEGE